MSDIYPAYKELQPIEIELDNLYLDPNNPRFASFKNRSIPDSKISDPSIQKDTLHKLETNFAIDKLVMNMEVNGYLPVDRVIVKAIAETKYVVLEGNRRISAAKIICEKIKQLLPLFNDEIKDSLKKIPCLEYTGTDSKAAWIFQGLRHIIGIHEWPAFNKAKLLVELMEEEDLKFTEVGQRFGLTPFGTGQWVRGYYAFLQAKQRTDYITEVDEKSYPYFQELFNRSNPPLREWLEWNEEEKVFKNELNFNEFLSWLYPRKTENGEIDDLSSIKGKWENRIIKSAQDLRTLSYLLRNSKSEFELFRSEQDIDKAYSIALQKVYEEEYKKNLNPIIEVYKKIDECIKSLENAPFKMIKDKTEKNKLYKSLEKLKKVIEELME